MVIAVRCSLLVGLLLCGRVSCTSYFVPWTETFLNTLSNSLNVYVHDQVYFDCSATNTSDVLYVNSKERFDTCNTQIAGSDSFLLVGCADYTDVREINVLNNTNLVPGIPVSVPGSSVYIIGSNADDCMNGLKLALNININKNPNPDSNSITITPTAPPPTSTVVSSSSSTNSGGNNVQVSVTPVSSMSPVSPGGGAVTGTSVHTLDATPTSGGTDDEDGSVQFFVDWSVGARVGLIVGCAVAVAAVLAVCLACLVCCYKCSGKRDKKDLIEGVNMHSISPDNEGYNRLDTESSLASNTCIPATVDDSKKNHNNKEDTGAPAKTINSINKNSNISTVGDSKKNHNKEDTAKTINSINDNKSNGLSSTKSAKSPTRPPPKNSIRPLRDPPRPPPTVMTSLPAKGSNNPPKNLPPLASLQVESPRRKAPPPPRK